MLLENYRTIIWMVECIPEPVCSGHDICSHTFGSSCVGKCCGTGTIWARFSTILKDVYGQIVAISTIVAVTVSAIALLVRMISRNQRAVDEATSWLKRIVVTWIMDE